MIHEINNSMLCICNIIWASINVSTHIHEEIQAHNHRHLNRSTHRHYISENNPPRYPQRYRQYHNNVAMNKYPKRTTMFCYKHITNVPCRAYIPGLHTAGSTQPSFQGYTPWVLYMHNPLWLISPSLMIQQPFSTIQRSIVTFSCVILAITHKCTCSSNNNTCMS